MHIEYVENMEDLQFETMKYLYFYSLDNSIEDAAMFSLYIYLYFDKMPTDKHKFRLDVGRIMKRYGCRKESMREKITSAYKEYFKTRRRLEKEMRNMWLNQDAPASSQA